MKEEALKLADEIDNFYKHHNEPYFLIQLQSMIRRLVEELDEKNYRILELTKRYKALTWNDKQGEPVVYWDGKHFASREKSCLADIPLYTTPQTKPLSDEEITQVFDKCYPNNGDGDVVTLVDFARAIEKEVVNKNTHNIQQDDEMSINMCINKDFVNKND